MIESNSMKKPSTSEISVLVGGIVIIIILFIVFLPTKAVSPMPLSSQSSSKTVAQNGDTVSVNYVGTLQNGTKFDSSYDRGEPITFVLGSGRVIKGWDEGILGMKVGEKKHLVIPPEKGYGNRAVGSIPANSTLIFDVELVGVN